jgi:hypothetical protein
VKKTKKIEEEDEEEEQEQRKEKSTLFFIFSPLSSCFSSIYSISIHCFFYVACHLQLFYSYSLFLLCCLPYAREKDNFFFLLMLVGA